MTKILSHSENKIKLIDPLAHEGYDAFLEGFELNDCTYEEGTDGEYGWKRGWREAFLHEIKLAREAEQRKENKNE